MRLQIHPCALLAVLAVAGMACGDSEGPTDADSTDLPDLGARDLGVGRDSGPNDLGSRDLGSADAGTEDARVVEPDAGLSDLGSMDATSTDAGCTPSGEEVCDGLDNDCNGLFDDVDEGGDGIFDCSRIALFGGPGSLGSSNFLAWLESNGVTIVRLQTDSSSITEVLLADYDVVILDRLVRDYTAPEAVLLRAWVEAGGALMSMTGYTGGFEDIARPNSLLGELGLEYLAGLRSGPVTDFVPHATTSSLTSITFAGGFRVGVLPGAFAATSTVVARLSDGPAAVAGERGAGRVFVWGDEWVQFDSEWSSMPEIPRFWANVLGWLRRFR